MIGCKVISIAESEPDVEKSDTKRFIDAGYREREFDKALAKLGNIELIAVTVDRDKYAVNYTLIYEV